MAASAPRKAEGAGDEEIEVLRTRVKAREFQLRQATDLALQRQLESQRLHEALAARDLQAASLQLELTSLVQQLSGSQNFPHTEDHLRRATLSALRQELEEQQRDVRELRIEGRVRQDAVDEIEVGLSGVAVVINTLQDQLEADDGGIQGMWTTIEEMKRLVTQVTGSAKVWPGSCMSAPSRICAARPTGASDVSSLDTTPSSIMQLNLLRVTSTVPSMRSLSPPGRRMARSPLRSEQVASAPCGLVASGTTTPSLLTPRGLAMAPLSARSCHAPVQLRPPRTLSMRPEPVAMTPHRMPGLCSLKQCPQSPRGLSQPELLDQKGSTSRSTSLGSGFLLTLPQRPVDMRWHSFAPQARAAPLQPPRLGLTPIMTCPVTPLRECTA